MKKPSVLQVFYKLFFLLFVLLISSCTEGEGLINTSVQKSVEKSVLVTLNEERIEYRNQNHRKDSTYYEDGYLTTKFYWEGDKYERNVIYNEFEEPLFVINDYGTVFESFRYEGDKIFHETYEGSELFSTLQSTRIYTLNSDGQIIKSEIGTNTVIHIEYDSEGYMQYAYQENGKCDFFVWQNHTYYYQEKVLKWIETYPSKEDAINNNSRIGFVTFNYPEGATASLVVNNPNDVSWFFGYYGFLDGQFAHEYSSISIDYFFLNQYRLGPIKITGKPSFLHPTEISILHEREFFGVGVIAINNIDIVDSLKLNWRLIRYQHGLLAMEKRITLDMQNRSVTLP